MTVLVTKANHDYWHRFQEFNSLESLFDYAKKCRHPLILEQNDFYGFTENLKTLSELWNNISLEEAEKIRDTYWHIIIYNDYIE